MELSAMHVQLVNITILRSEHVRFVTILARHVLELPPIATVVTLPMFSAQVVVSVIVQVNFSTQVPPLVVCSAVPSFPTAHLALLMLRIPPVLTVQPAVTPITLLDSIPV